MLTDKQKRFCDEYLVDGNATRSAIAAGYSEKTAYSIGEENLRKPDIKAYISERQEQTAKKLNISKERILSELAKIAFSDIRKVYDEDNALLNVQDFDEETAGVIAGIETIQEDIRAGEEMVGTRKTHKVKMWDKLRAIESICKIQGYNAAEKIDVTEVIVVKRPNAR